MRLSLSSSLFPREYKWEVRYSIWLLSTRTKSHFPHSIRALRRGNLNAQSNQYWGVLVLKKASLAKTSQVILITFEPLYRLGVWNLSYKHSKWVYIIWESEREQRRLTGKRKGITEEKNTDKEKVCKTHSGKRHKAECDERERAKHQIKKHTGHPIIFIHINAHIYMSVYTYTHTFKWIRFREESQKFKNTVTARDLRKPLIPTSMQCPL